MKKGQFSVIAALAIATLSGQLHAADCENVPSWLKLREVVFRVVEPTETYNVKVQFPDISKLRCTASYFEYGTDYYFRLMRSEPVTVSYYKKSEDKPSRSSEMAEYLNAHSVILAVEREKTPHYFEVTDDELDVSYHIYLSKDKGPSYVKRKGKQQKLAIESYR